MARGGELGRKLPGFIGSQRVASPAELTSFVARASAGERFVYCEAPCLIRGETSVLASAMQQQGLVMLVQPRRPGGGFDFIAVRTGLRAGRRSPAAEALGERATEAVFRALKRAANLARRCPTQSELAKSLEVEGIEITTDQVKARIRKLVDAKLIESRVVFENGVQMRVVRIVATGKQTALPPKWAGEMRQVANG